MFEKSSIFQTRRLCLIGSEAALLGTNFLKRKGVVINMEKRLCDVIPGERVKIKQLYSGDHIRRRLLDIGLVENTEVECIGKSPCGDPSAFLIRGAVIAIRREDSREIAVYGSSEGVWD